ncbi:hypothetical protein AXF42_Ash006994 [Apostasia shenzhenica]|uniref:Cystatin domain-containing protein n=1 Tax=Apostasia shenzhenica TaxID=1088818 RepID=A0A2I0BER7_9ASPA|nr:hypothetical protein AXF42_Ash006994 [Apostasia shenzhenica]
MASSFLLICSPLILLSFLFPAAAGQSSGHFLQGDGVRMESISFDRADSLAKEALELVNAELYKEYYNKTAHYYSHDLPIREVRLTLVVVWSAVTVTEKKDGELIELTLLVQVGTGKIFRDILAVVRSYGAHEKLKLVSWLMLDTGGPGAAAGAAAGAGIGVLDHGNWENVSQEKN